MQRMLSDRISFPIQQYADLSKELNWYNDKVITTLHNLQSLLVFYLFLSCRSVSGKKLCSSCGQPLGKGAAMIIETLSLYFHIQCFKVSDRGSTFAFISITTHQTAFCIKSHCCSLRYFVFYSFDDPFEVWMLLYLSSGFVAVYSKLLSALT